MKKRVTLLDAAMYLCQNYGLSTVGYLHTNGGNIVPKTYIHYSSNTIFTRDKKLAERNGYKYFEL